MKKIFFFFFVFLFMYSASAIVDTLSLENCNNLGLSNAECGRYRTDQKEFGLSDEGIKELILEHLSLGDLTPNYRASYKWNNKLIFDKTSPDNEAVASLPCSYVPSKNCIENAWVRTLSLNPAFVENNTLFRNTSGEVRAGWYYDFLTPPDDSVNDMMECSKNKPKHETYYENTCKIEFWNEDLSTLTIKQNNEYVVKDLDISNVENNNLNFPFHTNDNEVEFFTQLKLVNRLYKKEWHWIKTPIPCRCDPYPCGTSVCCTPIYYWKCTQYPQQHADQIRELSHSYPLSIKLFQPNTIQNNITLSQLDEKIKGQINTNADNYILSLGNAKLHQSKYKYGLSYLFPPYNLLTVTRKEDKTHFVDMLTLTDFDYENNYFELFSHNKDNCSLNILEPFTEKIIGCNVKEIIENISFSKNNTSQLQPPDTTMLFYIEILFIFGIVFSLGFFFRRYLS